MRFSRLSSQLSPMRTAYGRSGTPFLLSLIAVDVIFIVSATPVLNTRPKFLNKQGEFTSPRGGGEFESKLNAFPPTAELQLEQLKLSPNRTSTNANVDESRKPLTAPAKGTLNLEMPAVSDNSESTNDSGDILSLSKVDEESDKKKRTVLDSPEKSSSGSGTSTSLKIEMDYTPQDIAEYIFWTGDEPGVVSALNDFLQDELVDKDDVIKFLEDVKVELKLLKSRYGSVVGNQMAQPENLKFKGPRVLTSPATPTPGQPRREKRIVQPQEDVENEQELVARMNRLNVKLREDSLEEIIYRFAKELFRGGSSGEHSIQKFTHLVEDAGSTGHIPKDLEKNVLDILVSALVDSVSERGYPNRRPSSGVSDHRTPQTNYKI